MFKVGDEVMIRPGGCVDGENDTANPRRVRGVVESDTQEYDWFYVRWDSGTMNVYSEKHLIYLDRSKLAVVFCQMKDLE